MAQRKTKENHFDDLMAGRQKHILCRVAVSLGSAIMPVGPEHKQERDDILRRSVVSTSLEPMVVKALTEFYQFPSLKRDKDLPRYSSAPAYGVVGIGFSKAIRQRAEDYLKYEHSYYPERLYHIKVITTGRPGTNLYPASPNNRYTGDERFDAVKSIAIVEDNPFAANMAAVTDNIALLEGMGFTKDVISSFSTGREYDDFVAKNLTEVELKRVVAKINANLLDEGTTLNDLMCNINLAPSPETLEILKEGNSLKEYINYTNDEATGLGEKIADIYKAYIVRQREQDLGGRNFTR